MNPLELQILVLLSGIPDTGVPPVAADRPTVGVVLLVKEPLNEVPQLSH